MKHTPAPWKVVRNRATEDTHHHEILAKDTEYHREVIVCECYPINDDGQTDSESAANARLIAAAPELLEAIKEVDRILYHYLDEVHPTMAKIRAAIAKAEGR